MSNCRRGMRIPVNSPTQKNVKVEVGVEIGLITEVEVQCIEDKPDPKDLEIQLKEKVSDLFEIDGRDKVLTNICIYDIQ